MCFVTSMGEQDTAQGAPLPTRGDQSKSSQQRRDAELCLPFNPTTAQKNLSPALSLSSSTWSCRYSSVPSSPDLFIFFFSH